MKNRVIRWILALLSVASTARAVTYTPLLNLAKPDVSVDTGWGTMWNANADALDNALQTNGSGVNGRIVVFSSATTAAPSTFAVGEIVLLTGTQTLEDKSIDTDDGNVISLSGDSINAISGNTSTVATTSGTLTLDHYAKFDANGNIVDGGTGLGASTPPFDDTTAIVRDNSDNTKQLKFELSDVTTATTRTLTVPNASGTIVLADATQTLTGKTYDTAGSGNVFKINGQTISSVTGNQNKVATAAGTFPSGDLVKWDANGNVVDAGISLLTVSGNTTKAATVSGTVTNNHGAKWDSDGNLVDSGALTSPHVIRDEGIDLTAEPKLNFIGTGITCTDNSGVSTDCTVSAGSNPFSDASALIKDNSDNTKLALFEASGITTGTTRTITLPNRSADMATTTGTLIDGNCAQFDSDGNIVDSGDVCGGGGGADFTDGTTTISPVTTVQVPEGALIDNGGGDIYLDLEHCEFSTTLSGTCSTGECTHVRNATNGIPANTYWCYQTNTWVTAAAQIMSNGSGSSTLDNSVDSYFPISGIGYSTTAENTYTGLRDVLISDLYCAVNNTEASPSNGHSLYVCDSTGGCSSLNCSVSNSASCSDGTHRLSWSGLRGAYMRSSPFGSPSVAVKAYCQVKVNSTAP